MLARHRAAVRMPRAREDISGCRSRPRGRRRRRSSCAAPAMRHRPPAKTTVLTSDQNGMSLRVQLPKLMFTPQTGGGKSWAQLTLPDRDRRPRGEPGIPVVSSTFGVPTARRLPSSRASARRAGSRTSSRPAREPAGSARRRLDTVDVKVTFEGGRIVNSVLVTPTMTGRAHRRPLTAVEGRQPVGETRRSFARGLSAGRGRGR